jgi:hypothetical protein
MCKSVEGVTGKPGQVLDWVRWFSQVLAIPLLGVVVWGWWDHEKRLNEADKQIAVIEGNRYTSVDAFEHSKEAAAQLTAVWSALGDLKVEIAQLPPEDFVIRINKIDDRLREVEIARRREE